jgi:glycine/D-amino acid oxidase-like deaminating enzyme
VRFCGSLLWLDPGGERLLERLVESHRGLGYAVRLVSRAEIERLEPALAPAPALAALASDEGAVDSARATRVLLERALAEGAELRCPCAARSLVRRGARVVGVETERGEVAADVVVLAAGAATPALAAAAGASVPLVEAPGILVRTRPAPPLARRVLLTQRAQVWQARDGSLVVGDALGRPGEVGPSEVERVLAAVRSFLPAAAGVGPAEARLGWRPMPRDERPIAGFAREAPGLYLAVAHSGVTLAPLLGRLVADEILSGGPSPALAAYRPERFASVHEPA